VWRCAIIRLWTLARIRTSGPLQSTHNKRRCVCSRCIPHTDKREERNDEVIQFDRSLYDGLLRFARNDDRCVIRLFGFCTNPGSRSG